MVGWMRNNVRSACEEAFLQQFARRFGRKGAPTLDLEKNRGHLFFMNIKGEVRNWRNALSSTSAVHCNNQNSDGYCLAHLKIAPQFHFLK
jgi:hypothetical protein